MKIINNIEKTFSRAKDSFERFPVSMFLVIISAVFFSIGIYNNQNIFASNPENSFGIKFIKWGYVFLMATVTSVFLSLLFQGISISAKNEEDLKRIKLFKIFAIVGNIIILYGIYSIFLFEKGALFSYERGMVYFGTLFFFIIGSCYIAKIFYHNDYVAYFLNIFMQAIIAMTYSVVLYLGISAIYYSLNHLFGIEINYVVYANTAIYIFLPFYFGILLSGFPKFRDSFDNYILAKPIKALLIYILIPIFSVYSFILYIYFAKIIIIKEVPNGIITNLVLWFSLFSVFLIFVLKLIKESELVNKFKKYFPIAMIPLLLMMFYSIGIRISQYGFTENRYFVVVFGIFSFSSMLYYIFYEKHTNITILTILSLIILVSTNGPISGYNLTRISQNKRLDSILISNNMLVNNSIDPNGNISREAKNDISDILDYMNRNHRLEELKSLPSDFKYSEESFEKLFGFAINKYENPNVNSYFYDFNSDIEIAGYNNLMQFDFTSENQNEKVIGNYKLSNVGEKITILYKKDGKENILTTISAKEVFENYKNVKETKKNVDIEDFAIIGNKDNVKYKILFTDISCYSIKDNGPYYVRFYLLVNNLNSEE